MKQKEFRAALKDDGENIILVEYAPHQMAHVSINGTHVMSGNHWDFYPGCHGGWFYDLAKTWGEFRSCGQLAKALWAAAREDGMPEGQFRSVKIETVEETISR